MTLLADLFAILYFLLRGLLDAVLLRRRRRYVSAVDIRAPLDVVWAAASAHDIVFDGPVRVAVTTALRPGTANIYEGTVSVGDHVTPMAYREVEVRPRQGLLIEILEDGSAPRAIQGRDHYVACTLKALPDGTRLTTAHELTHDRFWGRIVVPLGARLNARRLRNHCERLAGTARPPASRLGAALLTGALTYASFSYLFDWMFAAVLLLLILIHEAGHALAMRWVGLPVQGIYFIPFLGGVAVAAAPHKSEAERGFVALMGAGFSLLPTAFFLAAGLATGEPLFEQLALVSAILNGLNLAPVLPLDGGHVADAALSGADPDIVAMLNMLALIAAVGVSLYLGWHMLTLLLVLAAPMALRAGARQRPREPISLAGRTWLVSGYLATAAFYIAVIARYLG